MGKKEPMIAQEYRPTAIDFDAPLTHYRMHDLASVINAQLWAEKEYLKPEKELHKSEKRSVRLGDGMVKK